MNKLLVGREGRAAAAGRGRLWVLDREAAARDGVHEIDLGALEIADADRVDEQLHAVRLEHLVARALAVLFDHKAVLKARAAAALSDTLFIALISPRNPYHYTSMPLVAVPRPTPEDLHEISTRRWDDLRG